MSNPSKEVLDKLGLTSVIEDIQTEIKMEISRHSNSREEIDRGRGMGLNSALRIIEGNLK